MSATMEDLPKSGHANAKVHSPAVKAKAQGPRWTRWAMFAAAGVAAAIFGGHMAYHAYLFEETDDAYVTGHIHQISPQVDGTVQEVLVSDNQRVKAGDVLARLDPLQ
jgi:membrane fusion protein (multidrug efflux system)